MHWLDIVVLVLIVVLGVQGVFRGAIREVFSLIGVGLGVFLGSRLAFRVGSWTSEHSFQLTNEGAIKLAGFAIVFMLVWLVCFLLGLWLSKRIRAKESMSRALMVWLDRMLGFLLGAAKVFVLFSIIVYALSQTTLVAKWLEKNGEEIVLYRALSATGGFLIKLDIEKPVQAVTEKAKESVKEVKETVERVDGIVEEITDKVIEGGEAATDLIDDVKNNEKEGE